MAKVLIFQANPRESTLLRLNAEIRAIQAAAELNSYRALEILFLGAVRKDDLQSALIKYSPDIVHFCGHGTEKGELVLEDIDADSSILDTKALSSVFSNFSESIKCVILNSCYSEKQANILKKHVPCIIGMSSLLNDASAISFSSKLYTSLANGFNLKRSFEIAKTEMLLFDKKQSKNPVIIENPKYKAQNIFISLTPTIQAKFDIEKGKPDSYWYDGERHFYLEVFVMDVPRDVKSVTYQSVDDTIEEEFNEETRRIMNFAYDDELYGDIEIRAMLWKNDGSGIGISSTLGQALRKYYMNKNPSAQILKAINEIEAH